MTICYINLDNKNPRDQVTISGLRENGATVLEINNSSSGLKKYWQIAGEYWANRKSVDLVIIGYTGAVLVPWMYLISRKKIIYNAGNSFYESMIISRGGNWWQKARYWLLDWIAFSCADLILLESEAQKNFIAQTFFVNPKKLKVHYIGADETHFFFDENIKKLANFTVVFRGKFLPEAGTDIVVRAAKELEEKNIKFRILGSGLLLKQIESLIAELKPSNLELITEHLPYEKLRELMQECHLSIGQVADHPRLQRTIPHKAFESLAMKLPYLTARQPAILELLQEGSTCFGVNPGDPQDLAQKISELRDKPGLLNSVAEGGLELYHRNLTSRVLGQKLITTCQEILSKTA